MAAQSFVTVHPYILLGGITTRGQCTATKVLWQIVLALFARDDIPYLLEYQSLLGFRPEASTKCVNLVQTLERNLFVLLQFS